MLVLVLGGAGGVGSVAIQIAKKIFGASIATPHQKVKSLLVKSFCGSCDRLSGKKFETSLQVKMTQSCLTRFLHARTKRAVARLCFVRVALCAPLLVRMIFVRLLFHLSLSLKIK